MNLVNGAKETSFDKTNWFWWISNLCCSCSVWMYFLFSIVFRLRLIWALKIVCISFRNFICGIVQYIDQTRWFKWLPYGNIYDRMAIECWMVYIKFRIGLPLEFRTIPTTTKKNVSLLSICTLQILPSYHHCSRSYAIQRHIMKVFFLNTTQKKATVSCKQRNSKTTLFNDNVLMLQSFICRILWSDTRLFICSPYFISQQNGC